MPRSGASRRRREQRPTPASLPSQDEGGACFFRVATSGCDRGQQSSHELCRSQISTPAKDRRAKRDRLSDDIPLYRRTPAPLRRLSRRRFHLPERRGGLPPMIRLDRLSLRAKLSASLAVLLASIAVFLVLFFPARMDAVARRWAESRAVGMSALLANAVAPG